VSHVKLNQSVSISRDTNHTYCMSCPPASISSPRYTGRGHICPVHSRHTSCSRQHKLSNTTTQDMTNVWYKMNKMGRIIVIFTNVLLSFPHPKAHYIHLHSLVWLLCKRNSLVITHVCNK